ncbi:hypothetical protein F8154_13845 [Alkaliphilus pronyensis]|uniref:Uncharacterized protein n=1 Tax=Alkaliphilus pronyensis TaxID=1482732 RepID=A0A6I0EVV0_9FIRM|nr:hypothetical protein [Alkaliphilus pronyensis]KAB3530478.1 hypothetical protein F8154_13845 [Alkaliphilus pronyensis]
MRKVKCKYVIIGIVLLLLGKIIYQNYIYYLIPRNPISDIEMGIPSTIHCMDYRHRTNLDDSFIGRSENKDNNELILKYLSDLDLIPIKRKRNDNIQSEDLKFNYMLSYDTRSNSKVFINYISSGDLSILNISSNRSISGFSRRYHKVRNSGYYKVRNSEFDYKYINNLIGKSQN